MRQGKPLDPVRPKRGRTSLRDGAVPVPIYHLHVKNISRRHGRSAVAAAAYRAGETLPNDAEEKDSAFGGRRDVRHSEIRLSAGAPAWMSDRAKLWNAAEAAELRKDARLAKEIEFALPRELPVESWVLLARAMADAYVARGHIVDVAIHDDGSGHNPHVHLMLVTRRVEPDGFGPKIREADGVAFVKDARALWETIANAALGKAGSAVQIDARSYRARGIEKAPSVHRGPDASKRRARRWGKTMQHDMYEARRELLGEKRIRERFPLLAARPDWPPERREPVPGLSADEKREWRTFWGEIDRRLWGAELQPPSVDVADRIESERLRPEREAFVQDIANRAVTLDEGLPVWRDLHEAIQKRMHAEGVPTDPRLDDWRQIEKGLREFDAWITSYGQQQRALDPVPGPDGRPIPQGVLHAAQDKVVEHYERPSSGDVGQESAAGRTTARAEIDSDQARAADASNVARGQNRLDWLDAPAPVRTEPDRTSRLDWLPEHPRTVDRERDERERER